MCYHAVGWKRVKKQRFFRFFMDQSAAFMTSHRKGEFQTSTQYRQARKASVTMYSLSVFSAAIMTICDIEKGPKIVEILRRSKVRKPFS